MTDLPTLPMLAKGVNQKRLLDLCHNDRYAGEQKFDGVRLVCTVGAGEAPRFTSRTGKPVKVSKTIHDLFNAQFSAGPDRWVFDGELVKNLYHVFDLIEAGRLVTKTSKWHERREVLELLFEQWNPDSRHVCLVESHRDDMSKLMLAQSVAAEGGEGVMFKLVDGLYLPGILTPTGKVRESRSDYFVKVKFVKDIDVVVTEIGRDGKHNIVVAVYKDGELVEIGDCTALAGDGSKVRAPRVLSNGTVDYDVVTVKCLYVSRDYRLVQPTRPMLRHDKAAQDCTWDQLPPLVVNKAVHIKSREV